MSELSTKKGVEIIIYEPTLKTDDFLNCKVINNFVEFINESKNYNRK